MATMASRIAIETERLRTAKLLGRVRFARPQWSEALDLPAELLGALPLPPRILVHVPSVPSLVVIHLDIPERIGDVAIDAGEWLAIVRGAEADRMWSADFATLCLRKLAEPSFRIDGETALHGAQPDPGVRWTARAVLERIGAEVISIDLPG
jgi:hypothetical protein